VYNSVGAGYCAGSFQKRICKISLIMPRNETVPIAIQTSMRGLCRCSNNNTRFATFNDHIKEKHASVAIVCIFMVKGLLYTRHLFGEEIL